MRKTFLIVSSEFPPGPGGIGNHAYCLASELCQAGHSVHIVSILRDTTVDAVFDKSLPFSVQRVSHGQPVSKARLIMRTIEALSKKTPLVVIASGLAMLVICGLYSRFRNRPNIRYVLVAHGIDINPTSLVYKFLVSIAIKGFHQVVAVSSYTAGKIKGVKKDDLVVINNGFDPGKFLNPSGTHPVVKKKGNPSLITVGSVTYRKGQVNVIKALPVLLKSFPDIHYSIIGLEYDKARLTNLAKELGVEAHITFYGSLSNSLLKAHLEVADIFVILSNHDPSGDFEGFGIAVLEANYHGVPVIGSTDSGLRDAIRSGYSGLLIKPTDAAGLEAAIQEILAHHDRYRIRAKKHAAHFLWKRIIKQYLAVLNDE